jgi:hypothetical protein
VHATSLNIIAAFSHHVRRVPRRLRSLLWPVRRRPADSNESLCAPSDSAESAAQITRPMSPNACERASQSKSSAKSPRTICASNAVNLGATTVRAVNHHLGGNHLPVQLDWDMRFCAPVGTSRQYFHRAHSLSFAVDLSPTAAAKLSDFLSPCPQRGLPCPRKRWSLHIVNCRAGDCGRP